MIIILGKTSSGKDFILNRLVNEHNFKKATTYTTRPMRDGEIQGVTYHYLTDEEFDNKIKEGFFAEYKTYETAFGIWKYGSSKDSFNNSDSKTIIILTPDGYRDVLNTLDEKPTAIYIYANNKTIKERLKKRGDSKEEAERRLMHDNEDFKGIENIVDKIVYNNFNNDIDNVVKLIIEYLKRKGCE